MSEIATFICSICNEASTEICVYCTKDACGNHLCDRCHRCSDCCECGVRAEDEAQTVKVFVKRPPTDEPFTPEV